MDDFKLKPEEEDMYDLYANHAMNALVIKRDNTTMGEIAELSFDMAQVMIEERRKRKKH